jgi:internalin A
LCFPLDDTAQRYLVPELLTKEELSLASDFDPAACTGFVYRYDAALPHGLIPRFIVQTYVHREPTLAWRSGVVLVWGMARALVRGDIAGRVVHIWANGQLHYRRELIAIIRHHFERIHESYEDLPVTESVPVPGQPLVEVPYSTLLKYRRARMDSVIVEIGDNLGRVAVDQLLLNVGLPRGTKRDVDIQLDTPIIWQPSVSARELSLFISYAHKDETYCDQLRGALTIYERSGELEFWDDTQIIPGQKWEREILRKLERADIIVLLLSNDFIRSDYCMQIEMKRAIERHSQGKCAIVPIVVRECRFDKLAIGKIQAIEPGGRPIKRHRDRDLAWKEVTKELDRVIQYLSA